MPKQRLTLLAALILVAGAIPLVLYQAFIGSAPTVTVQEAQDLLRKQGSNAALADVRTPEEYTASHIDGAVNWPLDAISGPASRDDVPEQLKGKRLLLICSSGVRSAFAARKLDKASAGAALSVRGGMAAWIAGGGKPAAQPFCKLRAASGTIAGLPFRESSPFEQYAAVLTGFVLKPIYMLMSLVLVAILWRRKSPDLVALRWGLLFFFIGEFFCAVNYAICNDDSYLAEYLHSFGMLLSFGFGTYAFFEGLDLRLVKYSDPAQKCAALGLCRACIKYDSVPCGLRRVFLLLIPAHIILAFMPLTAQPQMVSYNTKIFGHFYNFSHYGIYQLFEFRYCPMLAAVLFSASFLVLLLLKKRDPVPLSKILFAAGMGPFAFGVLRLILLAAWRDNLVWFGGWEEITEFMYVIGVAAMLWIFRRGLSENPEPRENVEATE